MERAYSKWGKADLYLNKLGKGMDKSLLESTKGDDDKPVQRYITKKKLKKQKRFGLHDDIRKKGHGY